MVSHATWAQMTEQEKKQMVLKEQRIPAAVLLP